MEKEKDLGRFKRGIEGKTFLGRNGHQKGIYKIVENLIVFDKKIRHENNTDANLFKYPSTLKHFLNLYFSN